MHFGKQGNRDWPRSCASDNRVSSRLGSKRLQYQPIANRCTPPSTTTPHAYHLCLHVGSVHLHIHNYLFSISDLIHDFSSLVRLSISGAQRHGGVYCVQDLYRLLLLALGWQVSHELFAWLALSFGFNSVIILSLFAAFHGEGILGDKEFRHRIYALSCTTTSHGHCSALQYWCRRLRGLFSSSGGFMCHDHLHPRYPRILGIVGGVRSGMEVQDGYTNLRSLTAVLLL